MLFKPCKAVSAGIITTYRCTNRCRHCLYCSSPDITENDNTGTLIKIIRSIAEIAPGCSLHIGGGEPLLEYDTLCAVVEEIFKSNLLLEYIETNGVLLKGEKGTEKLLFLKKLGLRCMLLSISPFHNEFISVKDNLDVFNKIRRIFGESGIFPWHPNFYKYLLKTGADKPLLLKKYLTYFSDIQIHDQFNNIFYIHPSGRAAFLFADLFDKHEAKIFFKKNCSHEAGSPVHVHMDLYGNYLAGFCSGITIGQGSSLDLDGLYDRGINLEEHPVLDIVINRDIGALYDYAFERGFIINADKPAYSSACHLCMHIRTFLFFRFPGKYPELSPSFFYEECSKLLGY